MSELSLSDVETDLRHARDRQRSAALAGGYNTEANSSFCYIRYRPGQMKPILRHNTSGTRIESMHGYAILPLEEFIMILQKCKELMEDDLSIKGEGHVKD